MAQYLGGILNGYHTAMLGACIVLLKCVPGHCHNALLIDALSYARLAETESVDASTRGVNELLQTGLALGLDHAEPAVFSSNAIDHGLCKVRGPLHTHRLPWIRQPFFACWRLPQASRRYHATGLCAAGILPLAIYKLVSGPVPTALTCATLCGPVLVGVLGVPTVAVYESLILPPG